MSQINKQTIYLIRHGQTTAKDDIIIGRSDIALSAKGKRSIADLAPSWQGAMPQQIHCSSLKRAKQTADILNKDWQLDIRHDSQLNEMNFGLWEKKSWDSVYHKDPEQFNQWAENWTSSPAPKGECFDDVIERCHTWLNSIKFEATSIMVIAHAGSLRALLSILLDLQQACVFNFEFHHGCVTKLEISDEAAKLIYLNNPSFS